MSEKSKNVVGEEEGRVTNNFRKLIYNLQHFPSKRSRLDAASLWNLIDELESFNCEKKPKSMQFTETTERKTYNKQFINVKTSGENVKTSIASRSCKINEKIKNVKPECKLCKSFPRNAKNRNQLQEKGLIKTKTTNTYICLSCKPKDVTLSDEFEIIANSKEVKRHRQGQRNNFDKIGTNKFNSMPRGNETKSKNTLLNRNSNLNNSTNNMDVNKNLSNKRREINASVKKRNYFHKRPAKNNDLNVSDESRTNKQTKNQVLNMKCKSHQCTPNSDKALQSIILNSDELLMDKCSVVKKLTNYWNNLLNKENEECSTDSASDNPDGSCQNIQSLDLSNRFFNKSNDLCDKSRAIIKSRHLSESNINIMKLVDDLDNKLLFDAVQSLYPEPSNQLKTEFEPENPEIPMIKNEVNFEIWNNKGQGDFKEIDKLLHLNETDFISELQNILYSLKSFFSCNTLPDNNRLLQPIAKKLLYIMVYSCRFSSLNNNLFRKLETHADKVIEEILQIRKSLNENGSEGSISMAKQLSHMSVTESLTKLNNNLKIDPSCMSNYKQGDRIDSHTKTQARSSEVICCKVDGCLMKDNFTMNNTNALTLFTPRLNINQVENALRVYLVYRELMWSYTYSSQPFTNSHRPFNNFTYEGKDNFFFIYEEEIVFEEERTDEDYDSEDDKENKCGITSDIITSAAATVSECIDTLIYVLKYFNLESFQILVRMIYEAIVSMLIWWVLIKEMFL